VHEPLGAAQERAAETAGDAVADDQVLDLEQRTTPGRDVPHATTSKESAKWQALT
jgi:hypothetical protein